VQRLTMMLAIASTLTGSLSASTVISGTFDLNGSVTATLNTISWTSDGGASQMGTIENNTDLSGSFLGLGDSMVSIENLDRNGPPAEPVGMMFTGQPFITFLAPAAASFPTLMINYIAPGSGTAADCGAPAAGGQTCTLPASEVPGGSPFTFVNTSTQINGQPIITSSVTFDFSGLTSDGLSAWSGIFTSQFNEPFQDVLNEFVTTGSVTNSYSDSNLVITLTQAGVPEPGGLALMGVGLLLLAASRVRFQRKQVRAEAAITAPRGPVSGTLN
jgi:hypothetical protein